MMKHSKGKTRKSLTVRLIALSCLLVSFYACEKEGGAEDIEVQESANSTVNSNEVELTHDQIFKLAANSIVPSSKIVQEVEGNFFGRDLSGILIDDQFVSYRQLKEWDSHSEEDHDSRLRITKSRVSFPSFGKRTLVYGLPYNGTDALSWKQINAAITAIQRYDALNTAKLNFQFFIGSGSQIMNGLNNGTLDAVIFNDDDNNFVGGADGRALFPSNGNPGFLIGLNDITDTYSQQNITVLIQHEMGHTIGLAHGDYLTRVSCNDGLSDIDPNIIEIIPGTGGNNGNFTNTVMRACGFFAFNDFRFEDRRSIQNAYNGQSF
ncbi:M57 family metalloprotease [Aureisphaera galaxeae]|uniref:M57 family metalloprotease n=1 Tax=Aureisphaera galaxeae TaxID=1538023 RepID=UPI00234FD070|nr:M57 family metalloprotease [Aureisphaera galaxeae]MDC8005201.1 M57 family metalloprotease [Aureisphaera galaxeae]